MFITNAKSDKRYIVSDFYVDHFDELTKLINLQKRFVFFHSMKYRNIILHNLNGINHIETFKSQCAQSTDIPHAHRRYLAENDPTPHESVVRVNLLNAIHSSEWVAVVSSIGFDDVFLHSHSRVPLALLSDSTFARLSPCLCASHYNTSTFYIILHYDPICIVKLLFRHPVPFGIRKATSVLYGFLLNGILSWFGCFINIG